MITSTMLEPILTAVTENVTAILPVGLSILGIMFSIRSIPKILNKFL